MSSQIVLIVDENADAGQRLAEVLQREGYTAIPTGSPDGVTRSTEQTLRSDGDVKNGISLKFISDLKDLNPDWELVAATSMNRTEKSDRSTDLNEIAAMIRKAFLSIRRLAESPRMESPFVSGEVYLDTLLQNSDDAIYIKDTSLKYVLANPEALRWFSRTSDEIIGKRDDEAGIPFDLNVDSREEKALLGQRMETLITSSRNGIPEIRRLVSVPISLKNGAIIGLVNVARDISEIKMLEEKLNQAQKMESIGVLASGIAHDFNNILGAIVGYVELARLDAKEGSREKLHLTEVLKAAQRASDLVKQILSFSRVNPHKVKPIRIGKTVDDCLQLIRASLPSSIEIVSSIRQESGVVLADVTQIHQVLMNLASNAAHAMSAHGGRLTVSVENIRLSGTDIPAEIGLLPGEYVRIDVADTGHGMDKETMRKIFEPYFTTKDEGVGTGLGLAVVRNIAAAAGGSVTVESVVGEGSAFHIFLPRIETTVEERAEYTRPVPYGDERILYVDDEGMLADIGKKMFEKLGYVVTAETNPILALDIFRANPEKFDLIITDQTMPNMTGVEMARQILKIRPNVPVVICSGFTESPEYREAGRLGIKHFLRKPIVMKEFAEVVRNVLDEKSRPSRPVSCAAKTEA